MVTCTTVRPATKWHRLFTESEQAAPFPICIHCTMMAAVTLDMTEVIETNWFSTLPVRGDVPGRRLTLILGQQIRCH